MYGDAALTEGLSRHDDRGQPLQAAPMRRPVARCSTTSAGTATGTAGATGSVRADRRGDRRRSPAPLPGPRRPRDRCRRVGAGAQRWSSAARRRRHRARLGRLRVARAPCRTTSAARRWRLPPRCSPAGRSSTSSHSPTAVTGSRSCRPSPARSWRCQRATARSSRWRRVRLRIEQVQRAMQARRQPGSGSSRSSTRPPSSALHARRLINDAPIVLRAAQAPKSGARRTSPSASMARRPARGAGAVAQPGVDPPAAATGIGPAMRHIGAFRLRAEALQRT